MDKINNWGFTIKALREERGLTQEELSAKSGVKRGYISKAEIGKIGKPSYDKVRQFATGLGMSVTDLSARLYGRQERPRPPLSERQGLIPIGPSLDAIVNIPILGRVPCGRLDIREESNMGYLQVPRQELRGWQLDSLFALVADGKSLIGDGIVEGCYLLLTTSMTDIDNGKIYVVRYDGQVAAKHVYVEEGRVVLRSSNPAFRDVVLEMTDELPIDVVGRVVKIVHMMDV
ncbi:MAG: XRE family transcriptional regulator [Dehalococcoidia bacterium]|nr:XRE family transcriptional regulator [Dehalococcoidia bacterium]